MKRGLPDDVFSGKPMIGICNSASDLTPCNQHLDDLAEHVKRGVWEAGGVPLEFPVTSLGEPDPADAMLAQPHGDGRRGVVACIRSTASCCCRAATDTPAMLMGAAL